MPRLVRNTYPIPTSKPQLYISSSGRSLRIVPNLLRPNSMDEAPYSITKEDAEAARYSANLRSPAVRTLKPGAVSQGVDSCARRQASSGRDIGAQGGISSSAEGPKLELGALNECAPAFADAELRRSGCCCLCASRRNRCEIFGQNVQAPRLLRLAFDNYSLAGDRDGMRAVRQKLESMGDDVSDLPSVEQPPRRRIPWPLDQARTRAVDPRGRRRPVLPQPAMSQAKKRPMAKQSEAKARLVAAAASTPPAIRRVAPALANRGCRCAYSCSVERVSRSRPAGLRCRQARPQTTVRPARASR